MEQILFIAIILLQISAGGCQQDQPTWVGTYQIEQTCDGAANPDYTMKVSRDTEDLSSFYLHNLGGYGEKVKATLQNDSLTIVPTDVNAGLIGKVRLSGTGSLAKEILSVQLNVNVPGPQGTTTTSRCQLKGNRL